ncbi:mitoguardin-like [Haemaphysalis longicornis]
MSQVSPRFSMNVSRRSKIIIASAGIGVLLLGLLTKCLRRRFLDLRTAFADGEVDLALLCSRCGNPRALEGPTSTPVDRGAAAADPGPQQMATMGFESLEQALNCWERAVGRLRAGDPSPSSAQLCAGLELLVLEGQRLRGRWRQLAEGAPSPVPSEDLRQPRPVSAADTESFVSAESPSASDDVTAEPEPETGELYSEALVLAEKGDVPCRVYRVEVLGCSSRQDYLAKMHCIRLAFKKLAMQPAVLEWLVEAGDNVLKGFLVCAGKDPKDTQQAFRQLVAYLMDPSHHEQIAVELRGKGVVCPSVYDVVIDYLLLDAFDGLGTPPQSVVAVIQNGWLSARFKEAALSATIWSLFKAKKSMLPYSRGFFWHYYDLMQLIVPVLAWGFLGTDEELKKMCNYFREEMEALVCDIFDEGRTRYTSVDDLAQDILHNSQLRCDRVFQALEGAL